VESKHTEYCADLPLFKNLDLSVFYFIINGFAIVGFITVMIRIFDTDIVFGIADESLVAGFVRVAFFIKTSRFAVGFSAADLREFREFKVFRVSKEAAEEIE